MSKRKLFLDSMEQFVILLTQYVKFTMIGINLSQTLKRLNHGKLIHGILQTPVHC